MADGVLSSVGSDSSTEVAGSVGSVEASGLWLGSPFFDLPADPVLLGFAEGLFERAALVAFASAAAEVEVEVPGVVAEAPGFPDPEVPDVGFPEVGVSDFVAGDFGPDFFVGVLPGVFAVGVFVGPAGLVGVLFGVACGGGVGLGVALGGVGVGVGAWACTGAAMPGGPVEPPCQDQATEPPAGTVRPWTPRDE